MFLQYYHGFLKHIPLCFLWFFFFSLFCEAGPESHWLEEKTVDFSRNKWADIRGFMGDLTATLSTNYRWLLSTFPHLTALKQGPGWESRIQMRRKKISNKLNCLSWGNTFYTLVEHNHTLILGKGMIWPIMIGVGHWQLWSYHNISSLTKPFLNFLSYFIVPKKKKNSGSFKTGPGEKLREREGRNHMKRRAFQVILITTVTQLS